MKDKHFESFSFPLNAYYYYYYYYYYFIARSFLFPLPNIFDKESGFELSYSVENNCVLCLVSWAICLYILCVLFSLLLGASNTCSYLPIKKKLKIIVLNGDFLL